MSVHYKMLVSQMSDHWLTLLCQPAGQYEECCFWTTHHKHENFLFATGWSQSLDKIPIRVSGNFPWKRLWKAQAGISAHMRTWLIYQLHTASGWATAINTERHINDGKVMTHPIKKEGTPKLHPYLPAIGNREAGDFPLALPATLLSLLQLFPSAKKRVWPGLLDF